MKKRSMLLSTTLIKGTYWKGLKSIGGFLLLFWCVFANAVADGLVGPVNVVEIWSYDSGEQRVLISAPHDDPDSCTNPTVVHVPSTADKTIYTTLMTALVTEKQVDMHISGCLNLLSVSAAIVTRATIKR